MSIAYVYINVCVYACMYVCMSTGFTACDFVHLTSFSLLSPRENL